MDDRFSKNVPKRTNSNVSNQTSLELDNLHLRLKNEEFAQTVIQLRKEKRQSEIIINEFQKMVFDLQVHHQREKTEIEAKYNRLKQNFGVLNDELNKVLPKFVEFSSKFTELIEIGNMLSTVNNIPAAKEDIDIEGKRSISPDEKHVNSSFKARGGARLPSPLSGSSPVLEQSDLEANEIRALSVIMEEDSILTNRSSLGSPQALYQRNSTVDILTNIRRNSKRFSFRGSTGINDTQSSILVEANLTPNRTLNTSLFNETSNQLSSSIQLASTLNASSYTPSTSILSTCEKDISLNGDSTLADTSTPNIFQMVTVKRRLPLVILERLDENSLKSSPDCPVNQTSDITKNTPDGDNKENEQSTKKKKKRPSLNRKRRKFSSLILNMPDQNSFQSTPGCPVNRTSDITKNTPVGDNKKNEQSIRNQKIRPSLNCKRRNKPNNDHSESEVSENLNNSEQSSDEDVMPARKHRNEQTLSNKRKSISTDKPSLKRKLRRVETNGIKRKSATSGNSSSESVHSENSDKPEHSSEDESIKYQKKRKNISTKSTLKTSTHVRRSLIQRKSVKLENSSSETDLSENSDDAEHFSEDELTTNQKKRKNKSMKARPKMSTGVRRSLMKRKCAKPEISSSFLSENSDDAEHSSEDEPTTYQNKRKKKSAKPGNFSTESVLSETSKDAEHSSEDEPTTYQKRRKNKSTKSTAKMSTCVRRSLIKRSSSDDEELRILGNKLKMKRYFRSSSDDEEPPTLKTDIKMERPSTTSTRPRRAARPHALKEPSLVKKMRRSR